MRIWDLPIDRLCRSHLLAQHREIHAVWTIITQQRKGYAAHPEVRRWRGRLKALYARHVGTAREMSRRHYRHASPLDERLATGEPEQTEIVDTPAEQARILRAKRCGCRLS